MNPVSCLPSISKNIFPSPQLCQTLKGPLIRREDLLLIRRKGGSHYDKDGSLRPVDHPVGCELVTFHFFCLKNESSVLFSPADS